MPSSKQLAWERRTINDDPQTPKQPAQFGSARRELALITTLLAVMSLGTGCSMSEQPLDDPRPEQVSPVLRIAFGSCNHQDHSQAYWRAMAGYYRRGSGFPAAWIWAGDNIYADTEDLAVMRRAYASVLEGPYGDFARQCRAHGCKIVGTWDDHDFGANSLRGYLPPGPLPPDSPFRRLSKTERKAALIDFLGEPSATQTASRAQVYAAYPFERHGLSVRLSLLDVRYDRQRGGRQIIGSEQWDWLERQLQDPGVDLHLLVSGSQFLREDTRKDTWAEFPAQRQRLFELIAQSPAQGVLLLSGDIHAGEISRLGLAQERRAGIDHPLYELSASGLNKLNCLLGVCHYGWRNAYQLGFVVAPNFGEIEIGRDGDAIVVWGTIRSTQSPGDKPLLSKVMRFAGSNPEAGEPEQP